MTWAWLGKGLVAGLVAGVLDACLTLVWGSGALTYPLKTHFVGLGVGVLGVVVALSLGLFSLLVRSLSGLGSRWGVRRPGVVAASMLAIPLLIHDAFAIFAGTQARRVPGHTWISVGLVILGGVAVYLLGRGFQALLTRTHASRGARFASLAGLATIALALDSANRSILPRLYPWFHLSLSAAFVTAWILFVIVFAERNASPQGRPAFVAVGLLATLGLAGFETWNLGHSQALRFFAYEKSQVLSKVAPFLPKAQTARRTVRGPVEAPTSGLPAGPRFPGSDVVLITLDAVRADHVSSQGYQRKTTPNLDALAAQGVRFSRTYTQAPHTSFALASLMTGKYYPTLSRLSPSENHDTLPGILRRYGWKTAAFFPPAVFYIDAQKMKAFESSHFDFEYVKYEYLPAEARVGQIEDFLKTETPKKLFLWLHLFEPHEPYEKHAGFDFGDQDLDRYDSEIAYVDKVLGDTLALLRRYRPSAIVIVSADHGEEFGEHGGRYHGTTLFDEQVRVPLVIAKSGLVPRVVDGPAELIDIPTTILGLLDLPVPVRMRGTDLGPWLAPQPAPVEAMPPAFSEVEDKRMVATRSEKLICSFDKDYCSYFDLDSDPGEKRDLADGKPGQVARLRAMLDSWLASQTSYERQGQGLAGASPELVGWLEQARLGDARSAAALAEILCGDMPRPIRLEAAKAIVDMHPPRAEIRKPLELALARGCDELLSDYAATVLLAIGDDTRLPTVKALLAKPILSEHMGLYSLAAISLGEKGDPASVPLLTRVLESCDSEIVVCKRAIVALGKVGAPQATTPLLDHLKNVLTRKETVIALGEVADRSTIPPLIELLQSDPYVPVRAAVAVVLGKFGGARVITVLEASDVREGDDVVRSKIRESLLRLGRKPKNTPRK